MVGLGSRIAGRFYDRDFAVSEGDMINLRKFIIRVKEITALQADPEPSAAETPATETPANEE